MTQKVQNSNGTKDTFTIWMAPEIGNYVQIKDITNIPGGPVYTYTATLLSTVTAPKHKEAGSLTRPPALPFPAFRPF
jgi:hypothetical protein